MNKEEVKLLKLWALHLKDAKTYLKQNDFLACMENLAEIAASINVRLEEIGLLTPSKGKKHAKS